MATTKEHTNELRAPLSAKLGATVGFLAFLGVGLVPGLLYGGYMGLIMAAVLFGAPVEPTMAARFMTGGGMVLGLVASLFLFLVAGAVFGTLVGFATRPIVRAFRGTNAEAAVETTRN